MFSVNNVKEAERRTKYDTVTKLTFLVLYFLSHSEFSFNRKEFLFKINQVNSGYHRIFSYIRL